MRPVLPARAALPVSVVALLASPACSTETTCARLHEVVPACDLRPADDTCGDVGLRDQVDLLKGLRDDGCEALFDPATRSARPEACDVFGWGCPASLFGDDEVAEPRYPLVFVSGIDETPLYDWNPEVLDALPSALAWEHVVLPGWRSREDRAQALADALDALPGDPERVNLVCYAVGGLDCRYLVSPGGLFHADPDAAAAVRRRVASVTTVSTPHGGTNVADVLLALPSGELREIVASGVLGSVDALTRAERDSLLQDVLEELTLDAGRTFSASVPDADGVYYQSWAGVSYAFDQELSPSTDELAESCVGADLSPAWLHHPGTYDQMSEALWLLDPFAQVAVGPTGTRVTSPADGMVAVDSAKWGEFRGCIPADHYDVIGRLGPASVDPVTGFDALGFLERIATDLAAEGL